MTIRHHLAKKARVKKVHVVRVKAAKKIAVKASKKARVKKIFVKAFKKAAAYRVHEVKTHSSTKDY